jgi:hypothetical protein
MTPFTTIKTNLPPSRAGIGRRLKTHKLIDMIAQIMRRKITHPPSALVIKSTIQIGPLTCEIASCLSVGVSGLSIFHKRVQSHLNVRRDWLYVSEKPFFIAIGKEYLYSKFSLIFIFSDT